MRHFDEAAAVTRRADVHAVTMTAELTEIFESREAGVVAIRATARERLQRRYSCFHGPQRLRSREAAIARSALGGLG